MNWISRLLKAKGVKMANVNVCTWSGTFRMEPCCCESEFPAEKLLRLEREYEENENDIKETKEECDELLKERDRLYKELLAAREAAKPKKTRGEEVAEAYRLDCCASFTDLAHTIDAEIATAKTEQREADAKIAESYCHPGNIPNHIRNQK